MLLIEEMLGRITRIGLVLCGEIEQRGSMLSQRRMRGNPNKTHKMPMGPFRIDAEMMFPCAGMSRLGGQSLKISS